MNLRQGIANILKELSQKTIAPAVQYNFTFVYDVRLEIMLKLIVDL
jgi:hypothetical protein